MNRNIGNRILLKDSVLHHELRESFSSFTHIRVISRKKYLLLAVLYSVAEQIILIGDQELASKFISKLQKKGNKHEDYSNFLRALKEAIDEPNQLHLLIRNKGTNKIGLKYTKHLAKCLKDSLDSSAESLDILAFFLGIKIYAFDNSFAKEMKLSEIGNSEKIAIYLLLEHEHCYILYPGEETIDPKEQIKIESELIKHCFCSPFSEYECEHQPYRIDFTGDKKFKVTPSLRSNNPTIDIMKFGTHELYFEHNFREPIDQQRHSLALLKDAVRNLENQLIELKSQIEFSAQSKAIDEFSQVEGHQEKIESRNHSESRNGIEALLESKPFIRPSPRSPPPLNSSESDSNTSEEVSDDSSLQIALSSSGNDSDKAEEVTECYKPS